MLSRYAHLSPTHLWSAVEGLTAFQGQISDGTLTKTVTEVEGGEEKRYNLLIFLVSRERLERSALALKGRSGMIMMEDD
jgi:hypothetical protein